MVCIICNTECIKKYCSEKCRHKFNRNVKIQQWLSGEISGLKKGCRLIRSVREYLLEKANHCCSKCGWNRINPLTGRTPLEINHIDGNSDNNRPENLEVICPNCHSLTSSWKALNKGKGNKERLRYSGLIERNIDG